MTTTATLNPTNYIWAATMLSDMGVNPTANNISNILAWMSAEEPAGDWYHNNNPLNINASGSGSDTFASLTDSATATANLIKSSYPGIYNALNTNAPPAQFSAAVVTSPWAASHYGVAAAGAPAQYIVPGRGLDYIATLNGKPATVTAQGGTIAPGAAGTTNGSGGQGTCGAKGGGVNLNFTNSIPVIGSLTPSVNVGSACQLKAFTGALAIGVGAGVLLVGAVLIASAGLKGTAVGAVVTKARRGPVGVAAGFVTQVGGRRSTSSRRTLQPASRRENRRYEAAEAGLDEGDTYEQRRARYRREGFESVGPKERPGRPTMNS